jgi:hypothetical protein
MAGIWNRIVRSEDSDCLSSHLIKAAVYLSVRGVFTNQQILNALNSKLRTDLSGQEITDLGTILTNANTGTATAKLDYLERIDALNIAVEMGVLTSEDVYRTQAGL